MAYDADETLWTPGRRHANNEIEDEFDAGVASLANGAVTVADFAPDAALPPWSFAQSRSRSVVAFGTTYTTLAAGGTDHLGSSWVAPGLGAVLVRWRGHVEWLALGGDTVTAQLFFFPSGSSVAVPLATASVVEVVNAGSFSVAPLGGGDIPRGARLYARVVEASAVPQQVRIVASAVVSRRWVYGNG